MLKAYCINLDRKQENFQKVTKEFEGILNIERVSAIDGKANKISGASALFRTQLNLFEKMIQTTDKYLIVLEDDIYKLPKFNSYWPHISKFVLTPSGWDFISLDFILSIDKPKLDVYNQFLYKTSAFRSAGFVIYNMAFLKKNLEIIKRNGPLDFTMTFDRRFTKLITKEAIVRQHIDKVSETNSSGNTAYYKTFYNETDAYLKSYRFGIFSLLRHRGL